MRLAEADEQVVRRPAHELHELGTVADVDRLPTDVRLGVARAVPVEVVTAGTPAAAVVLADADDLHRRAVRPLHVVVGATDRELPADVRLGLEGVAAGAQRVARAARSPGRPRSPARLRKTHAPSTTRVLRAPSSSFSTSFLVPWCCQSSGVSVLGEAHRPLLVGLVGEVRPEGAAPVVRPVAVDAVAAAAVDARPGRRQPGQVAPDRCGRRRPGRELDPRTGKVQRHLRHPHTLGPPRSDDRKVGGR